jgi:hypothetical protein
MFIAVVCRTRPAHTPIALGLFGSSALIHKRLERILDDSRPVSPCRSWGAVALLGLAALAVLPSVRAQGPAPEASKTAGHVAPPSAVDSKTRTSDLKPGSTIGGVVKDSAGRPMAGVVVHVVSEEDDGDADIREHSHKTDAEGRWQCNEVPADLSKTSFRLEQPGSARVAPDSVLPVFKNLDKERYQAAVGDLLRVDAELIEAESTLAVMEGALRSVQEENGQRRLPTDEELRPRIEEEFLKDPEVVVLIAEITESRDHLDHVKRTAKQPNDPAVIVVHKHHAKLMDKYENLWINKYEAIRHRLRVASSPTADEDLDILIEGEFRIDPEVANLIGEITEIRNRLEHVKETTKQSHDPAAIVLHKRHAKLMDKYENLWKNKFDEIRQKLSDGADTSPSRLTIGELRKKVAALKNKKESLTMRLEQLDVKNKK